MTFVAYVHAKHPVTCAAQIFYVGKGSVSRAKTFKKANKNQHYANTVKKYGRENILIGTIECSSEKIALDLEKGLIKCLRRMGVKLTNQTDGGEGISGYRHTDATKMRISASVSGGKHPLYGIPCSEERKRKSSEKQKGVPTGRPSPMLGKNHTSQTRDLMKKKRVGKTPAKGMHHTDVHKKRMSHLVSNMKWITNGVQASRIPSTAEVPAGWWYGRKPVKHG